MIWKTVLGALLLLAAIVTPLLGAFAWQCGPEWIRAADGFPLAISSALLVLLPMFFGIGLLVQVVLDLR